MAGTSLLYNSFNLNDGTNYLAALVDDASAPTRDVKIFNLVRRGGASITDTYFTTKDIPISGKIVGSSMTDLENRIDTLQAALAVQDKSLDIGYNGSTRRYTCTPAKVIIQRPTRAANWANFDILFTATDYGMDTASTNLYTNTTVTFTGQTKALTVGGSSPEQFMVFTIDLTTVTPAATNYIAVGNSATGQTLIVTRTWLAADQLIVDCANKTVTVNGTAVEFTGAFPIFAPGADTLTITSDFTVTTTYTANNTFTPATGVTSAIVELWGAGAAGGGCTVNGGGGGGGGGAYAISTVTVIPATGYGIVIGAGGTGGTGAGPNGTNTTFNTTTVIAAGGTGGAAATAGTGGAGGTTAASTGTTKFAGGLGGNGGIAGVAGGGGGEGAGALATGGAGANAVLTVGGAGGTGSSTGGDGGAGRTATEGAGNAGTAPAGAGGGAYRTSANQNGGTGARGEAHVTFSSYTLTVDVDYVKRYL